MSNAATFVKNPTYDSLAAMIQIYINAGNEETLDNIPFLINVAEKVIARNLRMPSMEKIVTFTLASDGEEGKWVPIPYDYLEMKFMWIDDSTMQRVTFDQLIDYSTSGECLERPCWAVNADRLYITGIQPDTQVYMTYYADVPELTITTQQNAYLNLIPDAFLYLAVAEGFRFLMEEEKCAYWENLGLQRLSAVKQQVHEAEFSGSPLVISPHFGGMITDPRLR